MGESILAEPKREELKAGFDAELGVDACDGLAEGEGFLAEGKRRNFEYEVQRGRSIFVLTD